MSDFSVFVTEQDIGDTAAFGAGQPGGDKCVGRVDFLVGPQRSSGEKDRNHGYVLGLQLAHGRQGTLQLRLELERFQIALEFGIRCLAKDHDGRIGLLLEAAIGCVSDSAICCANGVFDSLQD